MFICSLHEFPLSWAQESSFTTRPSSRSPLLTFVYSVPPTTLGMAHVCLQMPPVVRCKVDKRVVLQTKIIDGIENLAWNSLKKKGRDMCYECHHELWTVTLVRLVARFTAKLFLIHDAPAPSGCCGSSRIAMFSEFLISVSCWADDYVKWGVKMDSFFTISLAFTVTWLLPSNHIFFYCLIMWTPTFILLTYNYIELLLIFLWGFIVSILDWCRLLY